MLKPAIGLLSLCLLLWVSGCARSPQTLTVPVVVTPTVPPHLLTPLPAPERAIKRNRGLLQLLADYESLRRRANADRVAVSELLEAAGDRAGE